MTGMTRVVVACSSTFARAMLRQILEDSGAIRVVGEVTEAADLAGMTGRLQPELVLVEASMVGAEASVTALAHAAQAPVIVVSAYQELNAAAAVRLLQCGAADVVTGDARRTALGITSLGSELVAKIAFWARRGPLRPARTSDEPPPSSVAPSRRTESVDLIVIGVSTGGPRALVELLRSLGRLVCPVVIAQHMPAAFTGSLAKHLARETGHSVVEGSADLALEPGLIVVAPGERDSAVVRRGGGLSLRVTEPSAALVHPSVDALFVSAVTHARRPAAVVLTGMGTDGSLGAGQFAQRKLSVVVQAPQSCAVDGMPNAVIAAGHATDVLELAQIARRLMRWAGRFDAAMA